MKGLATLLALTMALLLTACGGRGNTMSNNNGGQTSGGAGQTATDSQYEADAALRAGKAVIIACGVGYPFFSTDTGMVLRAAELGADIVLSAKSVDYVYDKDPKLFPDARKYERLTYSELMARDLKAIDGAAGALARENGLKIMLFSLSDPENIYRAAVGEQVGTLLEN